MSNLIKAEQLEALAQHWERRAGGRVMRDKGSDFAQGLRTAFLQAADELRAKLVLSPMENPDLDWIDAMRRDREENPHSEVNVLLAQLEAQAKCIREHRNECFLKNSELQSAIRREQDQIALRKVNLEQLARAEARLTAVQAALENKVGEV